MPTRLVLGTTNSGKLRELLELLRPFGIGCDSLTGLGGAVEVEETGSTFAENAASKATLQALALRRWVLAEDSGLVVPVLGGAPGIYSARFSGLTATEGRATVDAANSQVLLERLAGFTRSQRTASYACHAALADPEGRIVAVAAGTCGGLIATEPAGTGGFGYDPLFIVPEYHQTFGELPAAVKAVISHRARAMRAMLPAVVDALSD